MRRLPQPRARTTSTATATSSAYGAAKLKIFANQGNDDLAIYNADEEELAGVDLGGCARRVAFCHGDGPDCEVSVAEGTIFYDGEPLIAVAELACSASTTSPTRWPPPRRRWRWGSTATRSARACAASPASPHRLEPVAEIDGVRFVNDSKATNVASAAVGLGAFTRGVHAILGGSEKGEPFAPLIDADRASTAPPAT